MYINEGKAIEIIAAEPTGKNMEQFVVRLSPMLFEFKKSGKLVLPLTMRKGNTIPNKVTFRLETVMGPIPGF